MVFRIKAQLAGNSCSLGKSCNAEAECHRVAHTLPRKQAEQLIRQYEVVDVLGFTSPLSVEESDHCVGILEKLLLFSVNACL